MADFSLARGTHIAADPTRIHALLDDLREWQRWSPWEGVDPDLHREYSGSATGAGSRYRWSGNTKAGEGEMSIRESTARSVVVDLAFVKPFRSTSVSTFTLAPATGGTDVTWTMTGHRNPVMGLLGKLFFDRAIGGDFERGLAALKAAAERS